MNEEKKSKKIPNHIGIIMDGNRRWARERNLPTSDGHLRGYQKIKFIPEWFFAQGVKVVSIYAFSTENWQRSPEEVNYLMKLLKQALEEEMVHAKEKNFKILISGKIDELPGDLPETCMDVMNQTQANREGTLNVCLNYGGRIEIIDAIKKIIKNNVTEEQVHEGMLRKYFYQAELPDVDVVIRTSGEQRLSGFLLWQSAYSEFIFMKKFWPDFEEQDAEAVLDEYDRRERRFGGEEK
ncbi:MAG: Isoprenyl transferase [Parcubacteria group bacterium GW2011_GWE2_39_37]|uniref:Isoprenyl transferase n=1 Tax=Candidatus Falkowbacteria bacterium GW2011_GWF2_39_8 TaxID=1618642 RepID=A0A0G0PV91_9BACT|nr:MAG: Isoprenyl transferase [Parcubacteria group bacterium GW2011_GWE2_39_37]KKR31833.1 MAG: Isoprenyl transferase [Candidatus Falkowbacteria bacterium GW2011_GWF2_39_8]